VSGALVIRDARPGDEAAIHALLWEFAEFEKLTHTFRLTTQVISRDFMGDGRRVQCDIAEWDGATAGIMIWHRTYSTFPARSGLFLEDIYVRPDFRRRGIATALLRQLVSYARAEEAHRIGWVVLDWNAPAMDFYERIGARAVAGWRIYSLDVESFDRAADA
jgi:GNAT superfamily N-acetyltransferase